MSTIEEKLGEVWYGFDMDLVWFGMVYYGFVTTIELASKNYPKKTPQMLKSVQWLKSYIFGLFRGRTASKK